MIAQSFAIFRSETQSREDLHKLLSDPKGWVRIYDNLLLSMLDSLQWIEEVVPGTGQKIKGFLYTGYMTIEVAHLPPLLNIVYAWKGLYELAPSSFDLQGLFSPDDHCYDAETVRRTEIVEQLGQLAELIEKAIWEKWPVVHAGA